MKNSKWVTALRYALALTLLLTVMLGMTACGEKQKIVLEGEFIDGAVIEYTGQKLQFPVAYVANANGGIVSYNVEYKVVNLADQSELTDEYATFELKTGNYELIYSYKNDPKVKKVVPFTVKDTTSPIIEFLDIPNGLFLQDITADTINKLPLYIISDASTGDGVDLKRVLKFKGETDADFREYAYREINNSYEITEFGTFFYELTATDIFGNQTTQSVTWKVKDRNWQPEQMPSEGMLADYAYDGYCNLVEGGDANQYYKIGNNYSDEWLPEFQGAKGVLKVDLSFNDAAGYGNNTIRLRLPKTFSQKDLQGKYLAVRIYVEAENIKDTFLFAGNNVAFREEDATTRAFTTGVSGLETGKWQTFYIAADTAEHIGMYPNAAYNPNSTFYEGGDPADAIQLCFHREPGYFNNMLLYVDSIAIAEFLPDTQLTITGNQASWTPVDGAQGYAVELNGEKSVITETQVTLPGEKGYIRVTPLGNGATTLDAKTVTGVYGLDAGDSIAKFDDVLYAELFNDRLSFSSEAEHNGYRAGSVKSTLTSEGLQMDIGTGAWGVVSGIRFQFPNAQKKGSNTTLVLNMQVANRDYDQIRIYDYAGKQLGVLKLDSANTGKFHEFEVDISAYTGKLEGIQLIFGPNGSFTSVPGGVSITFKEISLKNTYYPITVDGNRLMCAGTRALNAGYTNKDVVQFTTFYNFGATRNDTPLNFSGTVLLDGKKLQSSAVTVVGYPNLDTICFKVPHGGKVLTILKDSVIYYDGIAVKVEKTFNAKWNGSSWQMLSDIPAEPAAEYVTLADGSVKRVENKVVLQAGYTASGAVQFTNVYDFAVSENDTPLGFEGTVMLDGEILHNPVFVGYPQNTTIALKASHQGKLLTILQGAVIYHGETAVVVAKTFNAKWDGNSWTQISDIPAIPETQYVTLEDGTQRELVAKVTLTPGFTMDTLVQFPEIYDFGAPADSTPIGFQGTVLLQGIKVENPAFNAYLNATTVGLEKINHKGKVLTIMEGSYIYNDTAAVLVKTTFNAVWDGTSWTNVDEIPEPEAPKEGTLIFEYRYGAANVIQVNTDLPATIPCANFLATDHGCQLDQSANKYQQIGWIGMTNVDGVIVLTFNFNGNFSAGQTYILGAGSVFGFTDGSSFTLTDSYTFTYDGGVWSMVTGEPEEPEVTEPEVTEPEITEPEETGLIFQYRYGNNKLIQLNTNLPATTPCVNFLTTDNGCSIDQSANKYQQVGWIAMEKAGSTIVLTLNFNSQFSADQTYVLGAGSVFGFTDGSKYTLDKDYTFTFDGTGWTMTASEPEEPEVTEPEVTEPEITEPEVTEPEENILNFEYRYGAANVIQVNTDLPANTPVKDFLITDNGCNVDQSANKYQQIGWIQMHNPSETGGVVVLTFHFNSNFTAGQTYFLPAKAVFGFTDGSSYELDKNYTFTFDGEGWTMVAEEPEDALTFQFRYGTANLIQVNTNLPATTPVQNFLTTDNGSSIDQSANQYQQIGWIQMHNPSETGGVVVLTFHFNGQFKSGQTYFLPKGAVFGFADGSKYTLDKDYTFIFDGSSWQIM